MFQVHTNTNTQTQAPNTAMSTAKRDIDAAENGHAAYTDAKKQKVAHSSNMDTDNHKVQVEDDDISNAIENTKQHLAKAVADAAANAADINNGGNVEDDQAIDPILNSHQGSGNNKQVKIRHFAEDTDDENNQTKNEPDQKETSDTSMNAIDVNSVTNVDGTKSTLDPTEIVKMKKLNHKEVERRRRETINNAIRELQILVPTTHTNKSQIIRKASEYIKKLKEKEENLVNKWTLEKIITDQAISELANSNEKLKSELEKAYRENERFKHNIKSLITEVKKQPNNSASVNELIEQTEVSFVDMNEGNSNDDAADDEQEEQSQSKDNNIDDENIDDNLKESNSGVESTS